MIIGCPECGKDVSSEAFVCIHCGYAVKLGDVKQKTKWPESYEDCPGIALYRDGKKVEL